MPFRLFLSKGLKSTVWYCSDRAVTAQWKSKLWVFKGPCVKNKPVELHRHHIPRQSKTLCCSLHEGKLPGEMLVVREKQKVERRNNQEKKKNRNHIRHQKHNAVVNARNERVVKKMPSIRNK